MTTITNILHFLDENGEVPDLTPESIEILNFLSEIIEAVTIAYDRPITMSEARCHEVVDGKLCLGETEAWVFAANSQIGWECVECGKDGVITDWEGTPWDKRNYTRH